MNILVTADNSGFGSEIFITIAMILLTAFFLLAGSVKVTGWQKKIFAIQLQFFISYGLNRTAMILVGLIELFGAIAMWVDHEMLSIIAISSIALTSIGALYFHFRFDTCQAGRAAMVTLALSAIITVSKVQSFL